LATDRPNRTRCGNLWFVAAFLALVSALVYGCADFCGGKATRRAAAQTVTVSSQLVGLVLVLALAPIVPSGGVTTRALGFGALGGLTGAVGLMCLYHALSIGTMSIVSPVTAVVAASVPVVAGLLSGEHLKALAVFGIVLGLLAVVLVSLTESTGGDARRAAMLSLIAGLGFGFFFVALAHTGSKPGLWPLVMAANVLFLYASQRGSLAIVGVLSSLYPLSTVALARLVDHELLRRVQWAGLALAIFAVAAMSAG
jgi:drug/metabolite transporter (DMT)-like permease